jgi:hypothetical protein
MVIPKKKNKNTKSKHIELQKMLNLEEMQAKAC